MFEEKIPLENLQSVCSFLSHLDFFKDLKSSVIEKLALSMSLVHINGSETLIKQGDQEYSLFILYRGRLSVFQNGSRLAEISQGQIVGEISLLTKEPRTSTILALRDSILLKLTAEDFAFFEKNYQEEVIAMAKTAIRRLVTKPPVVQPGENMVTIAVVPAGDSDHRIFTNSFLQNLDKYKPTILINSSICSRQFNRDVSQIKEEDPVNSAISAWLQSLESKAGYIILETDREMNGWTNRCLRQADKILFVADEKATPNLNPIEASLFDKKRENLALCEIVFIHPDNTKKIEGTIRWLSLRSIKYFHHLRLRNHADWGTLTRRITGNALGVVLGGGAARGLAHYGALLALEELNIPIDLMVGSSVGAVVAGSYLHQGIQAGIVSGKTWAKSRYLDFTLPLISLLKGKNICELFQRSFGDVRIENLWKQYCCVSTNLTKGRLEIHDRGLMRQAIRSSISLPGIYPPIHTETGDILIDGGVINNLPVDIMQKYMSGGKILAICFSKNKENALESSIENLNDKGWVSGWEKLLSYGHFLETSVPREENILNIIMNSITLSAESHQKKAEKDADYLLKLDLRNFDFLEFKRANQIIDLGYQQTKEKIPLIFGADQYAKFRAQGSS